MSLKDALTNSLLMFVAATCVVLIVKALPQAPPPQAVAGAGGENRGEAASKDQPTPTLAVPDGVRVYYLHGNIRCPTCRSIEAYAEEAVREGFAEEVKRGKIEWRVVNYDAPGNEHYAKDYEVVAPNVVLAMFKDGKQVKWKGLPEVWEHVGNKAAFVAFVQTSLREFLGEGQATGRAPTAPEGTAPPAAPSVVSAPQRPDPPAEPPTLYNPMRTDAAAEASGLPNPMRPGSAEDLALPPLPPLPE